MNRLKGCVTEQKVCNGEWICDWVYFRLMVFSAGVGWGGVGWGGSVGVCGIQKLSHICTSLVKHLWALESSYCKKLTNFSFERKCE